MLGWFDLARLLYPIELARFGKGSFVGRVNDCLACCTSLLSKKHVVCSLKNALTRQKTVEVYAGWDLSDLLCMGWLGQCL
jgi:hypothetical protein